MVECWWYRKSCSCIDTGISDSLSGRSKIETFTVVNNISLEYIHRCASFHNINTLILCNLITLDLLIGLDWTVFFSYFLSCCFALNIAASNLRASSNRLFIPFHWFRIDDSLFNVWLARQPPKATSFSLASITMETSWNEFV